MRICLLSVVCLGLVGCAAREAPVLPTVDNLTPQITAVLLWKDAAGCHQVTQYADGTKDHDPRPLSRCDQLALWRRAQAAATPTSPTSPAAPKE